MGLAKAIGAYLDERRESRRREVTLSARLHYLDTEQAVRLLNLSATGAMIEADLPPKPGGRVTLMWAGRFAAATTMWVEPLRFGVRFDVPIEDAEGA